jgi:hypothetical protein
MRNRGTKLYSMIAAFIVAVGLICLQAGAAEAAPTDPAPYPVPTSGPVITVNGGSQSYIPGGSFQVSITNFQSDESVTLVLYSTPYPLGTFTTDAAGSLTTTVILPSNLPAGSHTIVATGNQGSAASFGFTVQSAVIDSAPADTGGGSPDLAWTGVAVGGSLVLALGLLIAGTITLLAGRRRASN